MKQNIIPNMNDLIANIKKHGFLILIAALSLAGLLLVSSFFNDSGTKTPTITVNNDTESYISETEKSLKVLLEQIEGIGKCDIMITLESGIEYIYATENNTNQDTIYDKDSTGEKKQESENIETSYKTVSDGNNEKPLIIKEINPVIRGVAIVCEGGGSAGVKSIIIEMVSTVLGISGDKISISKKYK